MKWKEYKKHINELDGKYLKKKPCLTRTLSLALLYADKYSLKNFICSDEFVVRFREEKSEPEEVLKKTNRLDAWLISITFLLWPIVLLIPKGALSSYFDVSICIPGLYRIWDIFIQRFRSIFVDPTFFTNQRRSKPGHLVDAFRSLILAVINYIEIVFIFAIFYKAFPCDAFNVNVSNLNLIYFSLITVTTVGYGDIHPTLESSWLKAIVMAEIGIGVLFIVVAIGALVSNISESYNDEN